MNNVTLIGASGFVGTAILNELLTRGHQVTAVARNPEKINVTPEKINVTSPDLKIVKADVADTEALVAACKGLENPKHHFERFTIGY